MSKKAKKAERHPWRENVEALVMAVVVALLFKYFVLEISKIPSGSMQPTLLGDPQTGVFDRVLVDKLSMRFRDPERWEIVVFKHPLELSRIMVKRLVGLPDEDLAIRDGDLWVRPHGEEAWHVLRRPDSVMGEMWKRVDPAGVLRTTWSVTEGGERWRISDEGIEAQGAGTATFRASAEGVKNAYLDGYPPSLAKEMRVANTNASRYWVGDLRLEGEVAARAGTGDVTIRLTEGSEAYEFVLPGPASAVERARIAWQPGAKKRYEAPGPERAVESPEPLRLPAKRVSFAIENLDDRLRLQVDGEDVLTLDVAPVQDQTTTLSISVEGDGGSFSDLAVFRDTYYLPLRGSTWEVSIDEGHYVMLGDNTMDSADSRDWEAKVYDVSSDGEEVALRGNYRRNGENPAEGTLADGTSALRFRDRWGELHWFARRDGRPRLETPEPLVPRELIQGRAVAVFWPLNPLRGLYRLTWLH